MIDAMSTNDRPTSYPVSHQPPNYLTVRKAAERLGLSRIAVRLRIRRGTLRSVKRDGVVYVVVGDQATGQPTTTATKSTNRPTILASGRTRSSFILNRRSRGYGPNSKHSVRQDAN